MFDLLNSARICRCVLEDFLVRSPHSARVSRITERCVFASVRAGQENRSRGRTLGSARGQQAKQRARRASQYSDHRVNRSLSSAVSTPQPTRVDAA